MFKYWDAELICHFIGILFVVIGLSVWFYNTDQLNQAYYEKQRKLELDAPYGPNEYWYPSQNQKK